MNLWHDIPVGSKTPDEINVIIEIPRGSNNKYEIDKKTGLIALDRANYTPSAYPFDYGFAPQTLWDDGDPLDFVVLTTYPLAVGVLVTVRPVALMDMTDSGAPDHKVLAVPINDRRWEDIQDLEDLNKHTLKEIKHFFETYKALKTDEDTGQKVFVGEFHDKKAAHEAIERSLAAYQTKIAR